MLPEMLRPFFWSYDFHKLDREDDKKLIVRQILNYGTKEACDWLFTHYSRPEIVRIASEIPTGQWSNRSLALWKCVLGVATQKRSVSL